MKTFILLSALALATLLNARTIIQEKYVHVVSSKPIYEKVDRFYDDSCRSDYQRNKQMKHKNRHFKHIVGYKNIGYYHGIKIVKKSHRRLRKIPIEIAISF